MNRYYSLNEYYKQKYGKKVYRLAISGARLYLLQCGRLG